MAATRNARSGPSKRSAAALEASKTFSKDFLARHAIPTAAYANFADYEAAAAYIRAQGTPIVIKADGLAAGKGVLVCDSPEEGLAAVDLIMAEQGFGSAGETVVI